MPDERDSEFAYCSMPEVPERTLSPELSVERAGAIRVLGKKWVNGTVLHYYFFKNTDRASWVGTSAEEEVVRAAFREWQSLCGLRLEEVGAASESEVRISFQRDGRAWSYVGRDVLDHPGEPTMNFGWNIANDADTALHEIGHTLGLPHEHQNPNAGILWNEEAVYADLGGPPNRWSREMTHWNIIRKIPAAELEGSGWDRDSIMHYPFKAGLILNPEEFKLKALRPAGGISRLDKEWIYRFYPSDRPKEELLQPLVAAPLTLEPGKQRDFLIRPEATRAYTIATFGNADTVLVLFERENGQDRYVDGDDDSGEDTNARLQVKLLKGREYVLRVRTYWNDGAQTAIMLW